MRFRLEILWWISSIFFFRSFPEWTKKFFVCVYGSFFVPQMPPDKKKAPRSFGLHLFLLDKKRPGVEVDVFFFFLRRFWWSSVFVDMMTPSLRKAKRSGAKMCPMLGG